MLRRETPGFSSCSRRERLGARCPAALLRAQLHRDQTGQKTPRKAHFHRETWQAEHIQPWEVFSALLRMVSATRKKWLWKTSRKQTENTQKSNGKHTEQCSKPPTKQKRCCSWAPVSERFKISCVIDKEKLCFLFSHLLTEQHLLNDKILVV